MLLVITASFLGSRLFFMSYLTGRSVQGALQSYHAKIHVVQLSLNFSEHTSYTGCANKNSPLGKSQYLCNYNRFRQICGFYRGGFRSYMQKILLQYLVLFKNYIYLILKVHFFRIEQESKLRF